MEAGKKESDGGEPHKDPSNRLDQGRERRGQMGEQSGVG